MKKTTKLKTKLTRAYFFASLFVVGTVFVALTIIIQSTISGLIQNDLVTTTRQAGIFLDQFIEEAEDTTCLTFANDSAYYYSKSKDDSDEYLNVSMEKEIEQYLSNISIFKNFSDFAILYTDGSYIGTISETTRRYYVGKNLYGAISLDSHYVDSGWYSLGNNTRLCYVKRLNDTALIFSAFFYREFDEIFSSFRSDETMNVMLLNDRDVLYSSDETLMGTQIDDSLYSKVRKFTGSYFENGNNSYGAYRCKNGWMLVTVFPNEILDGTYNLMEAVTISAAALCLLFTALISGRIASAVQKPIGEMVEAVQEVEKGNFEVEITSSAATELNDLAKGLSAMVESVKTNIENTERANNEKSKFLANTSHEIRTPMNAIMGYAEMIMEESPDETSINRATAIRNAAKNLLTIVNDILDFSKIESGKIELKEDNYHIDDVLEEVAGIIRIPARQKYLEFKVDKMNTFPAVLYGDDIKIRQILINLANNAIKFTEEGYVHINAKCERIKDDSEHVRLNFKVIDSGIGIRADDIGKVFGAFEQVDVKNNRHKEGSGLGLSIAREFARMMQGDITVESQYGRGTVFTVTIVAKVVNWDAVEEKPLNTVGKRILVVDDNETNLVMLDRMLKPYNLNTETAQSGAEVLANDHLTDFDLIFMDHLMPDMNGDEVTRQIRARKDEDPKYETVPIVGYTADTDGDVTKVMIGSGMNDCVVKPLSVNKLEAIFRKFLSVIIIVALVLPFGACGPDEAYAESVDKTVITLSWWGSDSRHEYMLDLIDRFEKEYPEIDVKPSYSDEKKYLSKADVIFRSGRKPDVMQVDYEWITKYFDKGKGFYDLEAYGVDLDLSLYSDKELEYGRFEGALLAVPVTLDYPVIFVNKGLFDQYGLSVPKNWDDLDDLGEELKQYGKTALCYNSVDELVVLLTAYVEQKKGMPICYGNDKIQFSTAHYLTMLKKYLSLIEHNVIQPITLTTNGDWAQQKALMQISYLSFAGNIQGGLHGGAGDAIEMFKMHSAKLDGVYAKPYEMYAINGQTTHIKEATLLLNYIINDGDISEICDISLGVPIADAYEETFRQSLVGTGMVEKGFNYLLNDKKRIQSNIFLSEDFSSAFEEVLIEVGYGNMTAANGALVIYNKINERGDK